MTLDDETYSVHVIHLAAPWRKSEAEFARRAAEAALAIGGNPKAEMALVLAGSRKLAELNHQFAGKNKPTDVLAFPAQKNHVPHVGDVVLARPILVNQAKRAGLPLFAHLAHLAAHGTLHLLGYDHHQPKQAQQMHALECRALAKLGLPPPPSADDFNAALDASLVS